jgi:coenzyme F420 hydrogenase subunit beta
MVDVEELNRSVFKKAREDFALGTNLGIFMSQSSDAGVKERGQYGGTVTALLAHGLESGALDGAILAGTSSRYGLLPEPILAKSADQVIAAAGSKYTACPTLKILDKSLRECDKLAVVGRPCQVIALRKRIACDPEVGDKIALVIGLFCMWSLDYRKMAAHLADKVELDKAKKVDIPYNRFVVFTDEGAKDLEYEPIQGMRNPSCDLCFDFTSEFADLSVGSTEWKDDWNTLIPRTDKGEAAMEAAKSAGKLAVEPLPGDRIELLKKASLGKKKRVLDALSKDGCPLPDYLVISDREKKAVETS